MWSVLLPSSNCPLALASHFTSEEHHANSNVFSGQGSIYGHIIEKLMDEADTLFEEEGTDRATKEDLKKVRIVTSRGRLCPAFVLLHHQYTQPLFYIVRKIKLLLSHIQEVLESFDAGSCWLGGNAKSGAVRAFWQ